MPKKKFIDKKNSVTFSLVHRSQRDPFIADDDKAPRVLVPLSEKKTRKEEERKYGVFYDDDYNYLQHLRDTNEISELEPIERIRINKADKQKNVPVVNNKSTKEQDDGGKSNSQSGIKLPSSVFGSEMEAKTGLLNKAAPQSGPLLEWDPDIVAGLDDDFNFDDEDNLLEDDFVMKANAPVENEEDEIENGERNEVDSEDGIASDEADMSDGFDEEGFDDFEKEETKSRFTNYSMTSSVIRRNEGLTTLDDRFEKFYEQYYDEEIGALDDEEIEGTISTKDGIMKQILNEFRQEQKENSKKMKEIIDEKEIMIKEEELESEGSDDLIDMVIEEPKEKWDCESIISTYSNLYNHPQLISEPKKEPKIKLTSRLGIPVDSLGQPGLTRKQIEKEIRESRRADTACTFRPKDETPEERRQRKRQIKDERKVRRSEKKINKQAFKTEKLRQEKDIVNLQKNVQGIRLT